MRKVNSVRDTVAKRRVEKQIVLLVRKNLQLAYSGDPNSPVFTG